MGGKHERVTLLAEKAPDRSVVGLVSRSQAHHVVESLLKGDGHVLEKGIFVLNFELLNLLEPLLARNLQVGPGKLLVVEVGDVVKQRLDVVLLTLRHHLVGLNTGVARSANEPPDVDVVRMASSELRQPKVNQVQFASLAPHDVVRLYVSVQNTHLVNARQHPQQLQSDAGDLSN